MANIPVQHIDGPYVAGNDAAPISTLTWTACTAGGTDTVVIPGKRLLLLFRNSGASVRTVAISSSFDAYGRKADIAATNIAAGVIFGRIMEPHGWEQALGGRNIEFTADHAEVLVAAIAVD